ncbi:cold shock domain-containing protein [Pseudoalteromonas sp. SR44-5]|nr:cold shock domain-containing protein [Pseudoalteromonas sp. SR44-5]MBB1367789.1 cold shock domain-containing protein [Pseudoalteromonas sp. SR44-5]
MNKGLLKSWNEEKGFGFIKNQMGSNLDFRHQTHVATL